MAKARDQLQKLTDCCICFKTFTDPRMLPCIHTFCLECLIETGKAAKKQPGENLSCPLCRKLFVIPTEGMTGLQKNFFMQHLMDVKPTIREGQKSVTDCDICKVIYEGDKEKTKEATMTCLECGDNFCDVCARVHKLHHKFSKSHNIVNIGIEAKEDLRKLQPTRNCAVHNQQPLSFYCAKCKKIICVSCFVENHASHKCKDVTSVEKEFREIIAMSASKISKCAEEMSSLLRKTDQRAAEVLLDLAGTEAKIRERNMELKEMIESHTNSLLDQLSLVKQKLLKDIAIDKEEIERIHAIFKSFETYCTELYSKGSASDICDCVDELVARANELEIDHEAFILRPDQKSEVFFKATNLGKFLSSKDNIVGQIQDNKLQQGLKYAGGKNYFNAVIQCLCQTSPLLELFRLTTNLEQPLIEAFVTFMNHRNLGLSGQKDACSKFFEKVYKLSPKLSNFRQHESHDLFIQFLNDLRSEETRSVVQCSRLCIDSQKVLTAVDIVFGGHFITLYNCLKCYQPSVECESFLDITLPTSIPKHRYNSVEMVGVYDRKVFKPLRILTADKCENLRHAFNTRKATVYLAALNEHQQTPTNEEARYLATPLTLTECLRFCTETEYIPEGYLCLSCQDGHQTAATTNAQTRSSATKRTLIYNPPAVLVLHIKRFEQTTTGFTKISDRVTYEELLDLGPYCSSDCLRIDSQYSNVWYSLYGVVVHVGSLESGQCIAYVKIGRWKSKATEAFLQKRFLERDEVATEQMEELLSPKIFRKKMEWRPIPTTGGKWICVSDTDIREASSHDALNQKAFMLFYERVPKQDQ